MGCDGTQPRRCFWLDPAVRWLSEPGSLWPEALPRDNMCESKVYLATAKGEELILEDVTSIKPEGDGYRLVTLFGEQTHVRGRLREIDLLKHRVVVVEPAPDDPS